VTRAVDGTKRQTGAEYGSSEPFTLTITAATESESATATATHTRTAPAPALFGDPHAVGLRGQRFKFDGTAGMVLNIYSSPTLQLNVLLSENEGEQRLIVISEFCLVAASEGEEGVDVVYATRYARLRLNNKAVPQTEEGRVVFGSGKSYLQRRHGRKAEGGPQFVTPELAFQTVMRGYELDLNGFELLVEPHPHIHGLIGQTWNTTLWPASAMSSEITDQDTLFGILDGDLTDYIVRDGMCGTDFTFNQFGRSASAEKEIELAPPFSEFWKYQQN